jgi:hypothetical protein
LKKQRGKNNVCKKVHTPLLKFHITRCACKGNKEEDDDEAWRVSEREKKHKNLLNNTRNILASPERCEVKRGSKK